MTMPRRWTLAATAALAALVALAAVACSSSYIIADAGGTGSDAAVDEVSPQTGDAGEAGDVGSESAACVPVPVQPPPPAHGGAACPSDASACFPGDVTSFTGAWVPPIAPHANACTAKQITDAYDACLNGGTAAGCASFISANAGCWSCLDSSPTASSYAGGINLGAEYLVNTPGCVALAEPCNQPCAAAFQASVLCDNLKACNPTTGPCAVTTGASQTAYDNCTAAASSCGCSGFSASGQCLQLLMDEPDAHPAVATCGLAGGFQQRYNAIAAFICGP
jgi:hypothetical protein